MPNSMPQKPSASAPKSAAEPISPPRTHRPNWPRHLGASTVHTPGARPRGGTGYSDIEDGVERVRGTSAGEPEEDVLQALVARRALGPKVLHAALGHDPPTGDDGDTVAHELGDLERVGAHQHGAAP